MQASTLAAALCLPLLGLSACMEQPRQVAAAMPGYAADYAGKAAVCTTEPVALTDRTDVTATMQTGGGGWCAIAVTRQGGALGAGLLTQAPRNGAVYIHAVGSVTRVDYTPRAAVTADSFAVKFIPGDETMRVTVTPAAAPAK